MPERVSSDHDAVTTNRATLARVGRTGRVQVLLPSEVTVEPTDVCRVDLDGEPGHARVETTLEGDPTIRRVVDNARLAREGDGENRLRAWVDGGRAAAGDSVALDVVTAGHHYGLRRPGERIVYRATAPPDDGLADIAADLED